MSGPPNRRSPGPSALALSPGARPGSGRGVQVLPARLHRRLPGRARRPARPGVAEGVGFAQPDFLTETPSRIDPESRDRPGARGTLWLMLGLRRVHHPRRRRDRRLLEEYANRERRFNRIIEVNIQNLAAVPSIVYGVLGLAFLVRGPLSAGPRADRRRAHPRPARAARADRRRPRGDPRGAALDPRGLDGPGATKWQTIWKQVLPAALPGIATGTILALSRAIGETAPLIVVGAAAFSTSAPTGILSTSPR